MDIRLVCRQLPSMFDTLHLEDKICQHYGDIRNKREFNDFVQEVKPDFLIHLAAQALVFDKLSRTI